MTDLIAAHAELQERYVELDAELDVSIEQHIMLSMKFLALEKENKRLEEQLQEVFNAGMERAAEMVTQ